MAKGKSDILQHPYIKVGRLKMSVAKAAHLKCADIYVSENYLRHIEKKHYPELRSLGICALDYVNLIVKNFNQIRQGSDDSVLLVIFNDNDLHDSAALKLIYISKENIWEVKTAQPRSTRDILKRKKLW